MTAHANGYELFSMNENFLTSLSAEDESIIAGGGKHSGGKSSKSKSKSKSKKGGSYGYGYH